MATAIALLSACSASVRARRADRVATRDRPRALGNSDQPREDKARCSAREPGHEAFEYDTSGDNVPDVRKVFRRVGKGNKLAMLMVCRETDVNGDGRKDVVRYYSRDGAALREEVDRDLNGRIDQVLFFERGVVVREEADSNGDGKVDTRVFYDRGTPVRMEKDLDGKSKPGQWKPSRWEFLQEGRVVRVGTDLDGDGRVDRWDRNEALIDSREERSSDSGT